MIGLLVMKVSVLIIMHAQEFNYYVQLEEQVPMHTLHIIMYTVTLSFCL